MPGPTPPRAEGLSQIRLGQAHIRPLLHAQLLKPSGQPSGFRGHGLHAATSETAHLAGH